MRTVFSLMCVWTLVLVAVTAGGCIALRSAATGDGSTSTDGADTSTGGSGSTDTTDTSDTGTDSTTQDATAQVEQVYCQGVIAIRDVPASGQVGVFEASSSSGSFAAWVVGDAVTYDTSSGRLTNSDQSLEVAVTLLGTRVRTARIITYSTGHSIITLDDSSLWITNTADRTKALDWEASDHVIVVQPTSGSESWLVNVERCEAVRATSAT